MTPEQEAKTFFFRGETRRLFLRRSAPHALRDNTNTCPTAAFGHRCLGVALASLGPQRCHYLFARQPYDFTVKSLISYGLLELSDFCCRALPDRAFSLTRITRGVHSVIVRFDELFFPRHNPGHEDVTHASNSPRPTLLSANLSRLP